MNCQADLLEEKICIQGILDKLKEKMEKGNKPEQQQQSHEIERKKLSYQKPRLICFGSVGELTAAGGGSSIEQPTGNGGCSNDPHRKPCR